MEPVLRRARAGDLDFFYELRRSGFRSYIEQLFGPWTDAEHRPVAERELAEWPVEIVECGGTPVGYQVVLHRDDHWFLAEIAVVESERGRGLGARLVRTIMDGARAGGLPLRLSVLEVNPAQRLYERLGFRVTRVEPPRVKMEWAG